MGFALTHIVDGSVQLAFVVVCAIALVADAVITQGFRQFAGWTWAAHIVAICAGIIALAPFLGVLLVVAVIVLAVKAVRSVLRVGDSAAESLTRFLS
ncbi:hypothetical protein [Nocardia salmonicida]|uniref:hypothetical protein n=1 Tax=Nocardia salmonicida TaxID=53431 RepID=UPI003CF15CB8